MSTNHHTDIAAGAAATAAVVNSPLGQLDAKLTHAVQQFTDDTAGVSTTVTTAGTYYAVTSHEVSFTPAYTGQVFVISMTCGYLYAAAAGTSTAVLRITDSVNATVTDLFIVGRNAAVSTTASTVSGTRAFTAGAGDVGVVRKAKLYVTHSVNSTAVTVTYGRILVVTH